MEPDEVIVIVCVIIIYIQQIFDYESITTTYLKYAVLYLRRYWYCSVPEFNCFNYNIFIYLHMKHEIFFYFNKNNKKINQLMCSIDRVMNNVINQ